MRQGKQTNTVGYLVATAFLFLMASQNMLSNSLKTQLGEQEQFTNFHGGVSKSSIELQPYELFCRRDIGGASGIYEFLKNTITEEQGICNIDKAKLEENQAFIFNEIAVNYSVAVEDIPGGVNYTTTAPAALRNAEFEITQGGRTVVSLPVASLHNPHTGDTANDHFTAIGALRLLKDNETFTWSIKFADGQTITAGTGGANTDHPYLEVRLRGYRTVKR